RYIGPQLALSGTFGNSDSPFGVARMLKRGNPETISGAPKGKSECAKSDCSERNKSAVIFIGEFPETDVVGTPSRDETFQRAAENADTFIKGLIFFIALVGMHAFGKRLGIVNSYGGYARYDKHGKPRRPPSPSWLARLTRRDNHGT